jgi:hypothetical protein
VRDRATPTCQSGPLNPSSFFASVSKGDESECKGVVVVGGESEGEGGESGAVRAVARDGRCAAATLGGGLLQAVVYCGWGRCCVEVRVWVVSHPVLKPNQMLIVCMPRIKLSYIRSECKHRIPMSLL